MHLSSHHIDSTISLATTTAAVCYWGYLSTTIVKEKMATKTKPTTADFGGIARLLLVSFFVFCAHMFDYVIPWGYSGHLLGVALLTLCFGPIKTSLAMGTILCLQVSLLGDGDWSTLGANMLSMAIVAPWLSHWAFKQAQSRGLSNTLGTAFSGALSIAGVTAVLATVSLLSGTSDFSTMLTTAFLNYVPVALIESGLTVLLVLAFVKSKALSPFSLRPSA